MNLAAAAMPELRGRNDPFGGCRPRNATTLSAPSIPCSNHT